MRFYSLLVFVLIFVWAFLGWSATVNPITNSMADQIRSGTKTMLSSQNSTVNTSVPYSVTYSRPFPSSLPYTTAVGIVSSYRTITGTWPVYLFVLVNSAYQSYISLAYYSYDSKTFELKVSYLVVNSNYIRNFFRVIIKQISVNSNINSASPYTYA